MQYIPGFARNMINYLLIVGNGLFSIYRAIFQILITKLRYFSYMEILYNLFIIYSLALSGIGWKSYKILINEEIYRHTISTNDFLVFLTGFFIMLIPAILKFAKKLEKMFITKYCFLFGMVLNTLFYILNFIFSSRISSTPEASFSVWFYLFGINLIVLWMIGVPGIFSMPSTRLRN